ncbi:hypothetical protein GDO78_021371 [Eleutherodactylus coqui]|uniref:Uncharacterized protein n=1 Tax=Eleutherodactylus coqui TaxID=57060 RepID=A0A8J6B971_ELECQ|nr:hypothetical protein GDO78_021371 [Eleutherodactylus coqui]
MRAALFSPFPLGGAGCAVSSVCQGPVVMHSWRWPWYRGASECFPLRAVCATLCAVLSAAPPSDSRGCGGKKRSSRSQGCIEASSVRSESLLSPRPARF